MIGGIELVHAGVPFVYAGGAVDYNSRAQTHFWRHNLEGSPYAKDVYCPICANDDKPDLHTLMLRNELALFLAERCVFLLDGLFTVGTPVEISMRMSRHRPAASTCIIHPAKPGAFVLTWQAQGATLVQTQEEAISWLHRPL